MKQTDMPNCIYFSLSDNEIVYNLKYFDRITSLDYIKDSDKPFWAVPRNFDSIKRIQVHLCLGVKHTERMISCSRRRTDNHLSSHT